MLLTRLLRVALLATILQMTAMPGASAAAQICAQLFGAEALPKTVDQKIARTAQENPLIGPSDLPFGAVAFDKIKLEQFIPALDHAFALSQKRLDEIANNPAPATFQNTIEPLESYDEPLDRLLRVFWLYSSVNHSPEMSELVETFNAHRAHVENSRNIDSRLLTRIETASVMTPHSSLSSEQSKLLETIRARFRRGLHKASAERVQEIDSRLTHLANEFKSTLMQEEAHFKLETSDPVELEGVPEETLRIAHERARREGRAAKWVFVLPEIQQILLLHAQNRSFREKIWRLSSQIGWRVKDADNRLLVIEIAKLREERARLYGYSNHAKMKLLPRMAKTPETVFTFLTKLADTYHPAALKELKELETFAGHQIEVWDLPYYTRELRERADGFDDEELRPYFSLDQVLKGYFYVAKKLYGVSFKPRLDLPKWDPSVRVYEVLDRQGQHLALYYLDPFQRLGRKKSGAWNESLQNGGLIDGTSQRPIVVNVANFLPPENDQPALLTRDNVTTLFHEGGHALHDILSQARYRAFAGTNVAWDFVELPSQFMENYAFQPDVLDVYARHYKTGRKMSGKMSRGIRASRGFMAAMDGLASVRAALLDMAWHTRDLTNVLNPEDVERFEAEAIASLRTVPYHGQLVSPTFSHIFSGNYSAGFYSYRWADVLSSDAFEVFESEGIFNPVTADRFRTNILERGGTEDAVELYRRFRGGDPDPEALLRRQGLLPPKNPARSNASPAA